jgi:hypothetical protein
MTKSNVSNNEFEQFLQQTDALLQQARQTFQLSQKTYSEIKGLNQALNRVRTNPSS